MRSEPDAIHKADTGRACDPAILFRSLIPPDTCTVTGNRLQRDEAADFQRDHLSRLHVDRFKSKVRKLDNATHTVVRDTYNVSDPLVNTGDPFDPVIDPAPASGTDNS
jgi:hypothetical protein